MENVNRRDALKLGAAAGVVLVAGSTAGATEQPAAEAPPMVRDCVVNGTNKLLHVHITAGYSPGHTDAYLYPGQKWRPLLNNDKKARILSAFTVDNDFVATFPFTPLHVTNDIDCLVVQEGQPPKEQKDTRGKKPMVVFGAKEIPKVEEEVNRNPGN